MSRIEVKMLGTPSVSLNGQDVSFDYKKAEAIFYYIVFNKSATRDKIAEMFWEDKDNETARKNLRHAICSIRKRLGADLILSSKKDRIIVNPECELSCDVDSIRSAQDILAYRGDFLEGFFVKDSGSFEQWVEQIRYETKSFYLKLLKNRILGMESESVDRVESLASQYLQMEPTDEELCVFLMKKYAENRQFQKAVELYQSLHDKLDEEYGITPLKETTTTYYNIIGNWNYNADIIPENQHIRLFGKTGAFNAVQHLIENNRAGTNVYPVMLIHGYSGVGKTFLLRYLLQTCDTDNYILLKASCYHSERNSSLSTWNVILSQVIDAIQKTGITIDESYINTVAELFPGIRGYDESNSIPNNIAEQVSYKAAQNSIITIFSKLLAEYPILLIIDDVHWMDKASVELLSLLIRRLNDRKLIVLITTNNQIDNDTELFLDGLTYDNLLKRYEIKSFTREETDLYVRSFSKHSYSANEVDLIYNSTGGNALSLTHLIAAIEDQQDELSDLPLTLNKIVSLRLSRLSANDRKVLNLIALFKEGSPFELLAEILSFDTTELLYLCGGLERQSLAIVSRENGIFTISIAHMTISDVLIEEMNALTKKVLHLRIAKAYETHAADFPNMEINRILAHHYNYGGDKYKAFKYKVMWMNSYSGMFCGIRLAMYDEVAEINEIESDLSYYDGLIDELLLLRPTCVDIEEFERLERMLYYAKGSYEIYQGMYEDGYAIIHTLIEQSEKENDLPMLTQAHRQMVYYSIQNYDTKLMQQHVEAGLKTAQKTGNEYELLSFKLLQGLLHINLGDYAKAESTLISSIQYAERSRSTSDKRYALLCAYGHCYLGECYRLSGDFFQAYSEYEKAIFYNYEKNNFTRVALFYAYYGYAAFQNNDIEKSRLLLEKALPLYDNRLETRGYSIALTCVALYDSMDGKYNRIAEHVMKARQINSKMCNKYWTGIVMYLELLIRLVLHQQKVQIQAIDGLWQGKSLLQHYEEIVEVYAENIHPIELERILSLRPTVEQCLDK